MRFEISHRFDAPQDKLAEALLNPDVQSELRDVGDLHDREVLTAEVKGDGTLLRRIRCVVAVETSGIARSMLGDADPAWVQEETWSPSRTHCDWVIRPEVAAELLSASGSIDLSGSGMRSTRTIVGDVKVRVPLYGGKVERWIVDGVTRAYDEEAERIADWLEREK